ncbi:SMI1/KNR4 family protein [Enterovibrio makurazakiensis]|uniref:SMI1/KNR4 family protein n=1 Tax=Enterovibrio makurazakiensis TaxID=2910232 RepID=UPI003D2267A4
MRNSTKTLNKIYQPPPNKTGAPLKNDWFRVEKQIGVSFPSDFKKIIEDYGSGCFGSFLFLLNPFETHADYDYLNDINQIIDADTDFKSHRHFSKELFPLASTENSDTIYFKPGSSIDSYELYVFDSRRGNVEIHPTPLVQFIVEWSLGCLKSNIIEAPDNTHFKQ